MQQLYSEYYKSVHKMNMTNIDIKFCKLIDVVEELVMRETKFNLLDLDDEMYMINFEDGKTEMEMATIVINNFKAQCRFLTNK